MSAKDTIVKVLQKNTRYVTQDDISSSPFVKTPEAIFEEDISDTAQQILDSLPRLSRDRVNGLIKRAEFEISKDDTEQYIYEIRETDLNILIDQICSLIPEQQTPQEVAEEIFGGKMRSLTKEEMKTEKEYEKKHYQVCNLTPAGEVIATGKLINEVNINKPGSDYPKVWICDIAKKLINRVGQSGKLIWVPDKEVEDGDNMPTKTDR